MKPSKGIYLLILALSEGKEILTGKLGQFYFRKGYYIYIGSAAGNGGIAGRLKHHLKVAEKPHWHIDYLRKETDLIEVYYLNSSDKMEHILAARFEKLFNLPVLKFGSSDCKCSSHLFYSTKEISLAYIQKNIHPRILKYPFS